VKTNLYIKKNIGCEILIPTSLDKKVYKRKTRNAKPN